MLIIEVMIPNPAIRNLIREDKIHQVYSQMQMGQAKFGMQTFNQSLAVAVAKRLITVEEAMGRILRRGRAEEPVVQRAGRGAGRSHPGALTRDFDPPATLG